MSFNKAPRFKKTSIMITKSPKVVPVVKKKTKTTPTKPLWHRGIYLKPAHPDTFAED